MNDQLHLKKKTKTKKRWTNVPFHNKLILLGMQLLKWFLKLCVRQP